MNKLLSILLTNQLYEGLSNSNSSELSDVIEHICGDEPSPIEDKRRLFTDYNELRQALVESTNREYEVYESELDNGNVCFVVVFHVKGVPFMTVPMKNALEELELCVPKNVVAPEEGYTCVHCKEFDTHCDKYVNAETEPLINDLKIAHQKIRKAEDVPVRVIDKDVYSEKLKNKIPGNEYSGDDLTTGSNVGFYADMSGNTAQTLKYIPALGKIEIGDLTDGDDGSEILLACNKKARNAVLMECATNDLLESFFIVDKSALSRSIKDIFIEESLSRTLRKNTYDKVNTVKAERTLVKSTNIEDNAHELAALPVKEAKRIKGMNRSIRGLIANVKRANDDDLREKVYNDEFVPVFDDFFEIFVSATTTYGVIALRILNPMMGLLLGVLVFITANWKQRIDRRRVMELLDDKIKMLEEEIEDARTENDLALKRQLIQIKLQMERRRAKIVAGGSKAAR